MLFLGLEYLVEQVAADVVLVSFAIGNTGPQVGNGVELEVEVALQNLGHILSYSQLAQILHIRQSLEEQHAFDQGIGMFHFVDGFSELVVAQFGQAPVLQYARVQEVLVDCGQLVLEDLVQMFDDGGIAFHWKLRVGFAIMGWLTMIAASTADSSRISVLQAVGVDPPKKKPRKRGSRIDQCKQLPGQGGARPWTDYRFAAQRNFWPADSHAESRTPFPCRSRSSSPLRVVPAAPKDP